MTTSRRARAILRLLPAVAAIGAALALSGCYYYPYPYGYYGGGYAYAPVYRPYYRPYYQP